MQEAVSARVPTMQRRFLSLRARVGAGAPTLAETALATASAILLILSFPNFDLWYLAWFGFVPLFVTVARRPKAGSAFLLGWLTGAVFFYGTCYWLTYSMIHYGHLSAWLSYSLLLIPVAWIALFPALFCLLLARGVARWGRTALFAAPFLWVSLEWARLGITGQLWNAIGYSQAYAPALIQTARWGGVYAVGFLIVLANSTLAYLWLERSRRAAVAAVTVLVTISAIILVSRPSLTVGLLTRDAAQASLQPDAVVVAVQPNVPMELTGDLKETEALINRHVSLSTEALQTWESQQAPSKPWGSAPGDASTQDPSQGEGGIARLVIWPESPMNFTYTHDTELRERVAEFATRNRTSLLFNSLEPAPASGAYNSALMVNEAGRLVAQYDKIRLMPFGEYVPLPHWLPGASQVRALVGDFTPGQAYPLVPFGNLDAGVFICIESAYPSIARTFTNEGADVLVNISNDGYLGPTPVMRQHLANAIFRAVENNRPVMRVTNTGITALIDAHGKVEDATAGFQPTARTWVAKRAGAKTFYANYGDIFVAGCGVISLGAMAASVVARRKKRLSPYVAE